MTRNALAVVLEQPEHLVLSRLALTEPDDDDIVVDVRYSGVSTGTERLLWSGRMPDFPGMGYPLVPGYESVGVVVEAGARATYAVGDHVFVPGARCFGDVRGLFGGAASRLVVASSRAIGIGNDLDECGVLLALAATAHHALAAEGARPAELIVGHGVLGRLLARMAVALGHVPPVVWERNADRATGARGYEVVSPAAEAGRPYRCIVDASGDASILDDLIRTLAPGGEIVLAGFYDRPVAFDFPPAFMREARLRISAEWQPSDLESVMALIDGRRLDLAGLITHRRVASDASDAYRTAFDDPECLKMILDWRQVQ